MRPRALDPKGIGKLPPESLQGLAQALVQLSRPSKWCEKAPNGLEKGLKVA